MSATFATISNLMRLNRFAREREPEPEPEQPSSPPPAVASSVPPGKTFPADEVVWGIVIRNGFDEMDDPWYHRGTTQHAYLAGNDNVAICGFRPPQSGPRSRRRARLGMPTVGIHPMCGICARMVVAPRPRVPVPIQAGQPPVAIPVTPGTAPPPAPSQPPVPAATRPPANTPVVGSVHDSGLMARGVHIQVED